MKLKKIIAATMVGALSVATVPLIAPTPVDHVLTAQAEAAKGGARIAPKATPKAAPKASEGQSSSGKSGWGNTLRNIGLLAGGMMLGGLLASLLGGMGSGLLADILGVLVNVAIAVVAFMVLRWLWNRFRSRKEEENVYQRAEQPRAAAPQPPITDIRPQGSAPQSAAPMDITPPTSALDAGDSPRAIADRYRNR